MRDPDLHDLPLPLDRPRTVGDRTVGPLGFGCWRFTGTDVAASADLVDTALDLGLTLVDTADVYGLDWGGRGFGSCEQHLGEVLAHRPSLRDRMVLATKGGIVPGIPYVSAGAALQRACEASLRRLGVDHVDLYQVHRPDLFTHPAEVADALGALVRRGLTAHVGVSNHTPAQTAALQAHLEVPLATTQPEWSAAHLAPMRDGTFDHAMATRTTVLGWSPLAGGRLATGEGLPPELVTTLDQLADREGVSRSTVALAFALAHPVAAVAIVGTQRPDRLHEAVAATSVRLTRADVYRIVVAAEGVPLP